MTTCRFCIAPANPDKPVIYGAVATCDRHCPYSGDGAHVVDPGSLEDDGTYLAVTCRECGQAAQLRKVDLRWL